MYEKSIELLNKAIADELSAVHQYMYFHFHCADQGFELLSSLFRRTAIEEMMHIELLAERIIYLKGDVEMAASAEVVKEHDVAKMIQKAIQMEQGSIRDYNLWANECSANADSGSKKIFEQLVDEEEVHFDQFDNEKDNLERFGDRYLALQSIEMSKRVAAGPPAA